MIFLEPSLRTRVGFIAAASRLGWDHAEVFEHRSSRTSMKESWHDTMRVVAGYSDVIVARAARPMTDADRGLYPRPLINGGDAGPEAEHPSQALVDLFAIEEIVGPVGLLSVGVVGDPRMRAVRSLLVLLAARRPAGLVVLSDPEHTKDVTFPPGLEPKLATSWHDLAGVDVLYVAGIPHEALPLDRRAGLILTATRLENLHPQCKVLSPMPVIDEMDERARRDARNRMFDQSDLGLYVRMALLERVVDA